MYGYCLSPYTRKRCTVFKQLDGLNFEGLAGKHQKHQISPHQNFVLYGSALAYVTTLHFIFTLKRD